MTEHVLDRPILAALATRHGAFAQGGPLAMRYIPEISPFAATADDSPQALSALAELVPAQDKVLQVQAGDIAVPTGMVSETAFAAVQMLARTVTVPAEDTPFIELSDGDAPEMLDLANLTKPGPFLSRTHAFGGYIGIRVEGRLAAMAGHRLKVPGFTEISAVCTHPEFRGRGYASCLMRVLAGRIQASGDTPFLHTYAANAGAIRLYEQLGFVHRATLNGRVLRRL
jgi:predicted GNAT family acetyltransferase